MHCDTAEEAGRSMSAARTGGWTMSDPDKINGLLNQLRGRCLMLRPPHGPDAALAVIDELQAEIDKVRGWKDGEPPAEPRPARPPRRVRVT